MSTINTGSIDNNFPIPGRNNSSQGFRSNFTGIKNNLDIAKEEISDLQNKAVLKSPLIGGVLNNDMDNGLISNALTQGFRRTTFNLGNNLTGTVTIDVTRGDVQYGTVTGNLTLGFAKWPPAGTQANIELILTVSSYNISIAFPAQVDQSRFTIENYAVSGNTIKVPRGTNQIHLSITTEDCGTTLTVAPMNRPKKAAQLINDTPATANLLGTGTISTNYSGPSTEVQGVGTAFLSEMKPGRVMLTNANVVIGTVDNIASDTQLFLTTNAAVTINPADTYRSVVPIGAEGDQVGTIMADSNYIYACIATYDGTTAIWRRISYGTY